MRCDQSLGQGSEHEVGSCENGHGVFIHYIGIYYAVDIGVFSSALNDSSYQS